MCEADIELYEKSAEGSFANPTVDESIVLAVVSYFEECETAYSHEVIADVSDEKQVSENTVRKAIRKLFLGKRIVPAPPFVGEFELSDES